MGKVCQQCGSEFEARSNGQKFCSVACRDLHSVDSAGVLSRRPCEVCGAIFSPRTSRSRFCPRCRNLSSKTRNRMLGRKNTCEREGCTNEAEVKFRGQMVCESCLNPDPDAEYLERERQFYGGHRESSLSRVGEKFATPDARISHEERTRSARAVRRLSKIDAAYSCQIGRGTKREIEK